MIVEKNEIKRFLKHEGYLIYGSLVEAKGYPYRTTWTGRTPKVNFLFTKEEYDRVYKELDKFKTYEELIVKISDLPVIINSLELLYYENGDFYALYDGVELEDVKVLIDKLKSVK